MPSSFRINQQLQDLLARTATATGKNKSDIVREAIEQYCAKAVAAKYDSLYDVLMSSGYEPLDTGITDLSTNKERLWGGSLDSKARRTRNR
jgi:hypothetical protein